MIVQGDVFIVRADEVPAGAVRREKESRGHVLAEGESSGHAHVINEDVELYEHDGILYIHSSVVAHVFHEEHAPVILHPGIWKVGIVREYDVFNPHAEGGYVSD